MAEGTTRPRPWAQANSTCAAGLAAGRVEVHGYVDVDIGGTIDDQLAALKNQLSEVTKTVIAQDQEIRRLARETEKSFEQERSEREKANTQIGEAVRANAPLEIVGAALIALGIILSGRWLLMKRGARRRPAPLLGAG